jgi:hypothetical protein
MQQHAVRLIGSPAAGGLFALLARLAGVPRSRAEWRLIRRPSFHNSIGELEFDERTAFVTLHRSARGSEPAEKLYQLDVTELTRPAAPAR